MIYYMNDLFSQAMNGFLSCVFRLFPEHLNVTWSWLEALWLVNVLIYLDPMGSKTASISGWNLNLSEKKLAASDGTSCM